MSLYQQLFKRFQILEEASRQLKLLVKKQKISGYNELIRKEYIQHSILQHYEVCETPLLDITHSIHAACSFAQTENYQEREFAYIYVLGLPYLPNRISINSEHDLVNVRLLSISPPDALRPYFQDGYLTGTTDITTEYIHKTELDFRNRLIAKFVIPNAPSFWTNKFSKIPKDILYPKNDRVKKLCESITFTGDILFSPKDLGLFLDAWRKLEMEIISRSRDLESGIRNIASAISMLVKYEKIDFSLSMRIDDLRKFRNNLIHGSERIDYSELPKRTEQVLDVYEELLKIKK